MVRFTREVGVHDWSRELAEILKLASRWSITARQDVAIIAIDDGHPSDTLLHGQALAIDLDPASDRSDHSVQLAHYLAQRLSLGWQVVLEFDHVHAEFDSGRRI